MKKIRPNINNKEFIEVKFVKLGLKRIKKFARQDAVIFDLKSVFPKEKTDFSL